MLMNTLILRRNLQGMIVWTKYDPTCAKNRPRVGPNRKLWTSVGRNHHRFLHVGFRDRFERHSGSSPKVDLRTELHADHAGPVHLLFGLFPDVDAVRDS